MFKSCAAKPTNDCISVLVVLPSRVIRLRMAVEMAKTEEFCLVCGESCVCQTRSRRRRSGKVTPVTLSESSIDSSQVTTIPTDSPTEKSQPRRAVRQSTQEADTEEFDTGMIAAVRALAHMVDRNDLEPFVDHLLPSDYLHPDERAASWRRKINE